MSYMTLLVNVNVAYIITGGAGTKLHNFFLFILAYLGLSSLIVAHQLFFMIIYNYGKLPKQRLICTVH